VNASQHLGGKKVQAKDILKVDWRCTQIFKDYIINEYDRNFKFRDAANGTLTPGQISQIDKI